ncbi:uncharacterized protein [Primulina eburnea]|uniref:uncharacterized protein n=1 Tax=Primulina eburnea TaxID=1245227 RepID=UPI003C6C4F19
MIVACWNVRGLHKPLKQKSVQSLMHTRKIDVIGILESKLDEQSLSSMMRIRFPGMKVIHNFCLNTRGRICVVWNPNKVDLNVLSMTEQSVHVCIEYLSSKTRICASFVYGLHTIVLRRALWDDLIEFGATNSLPWMVLGDFNTVLSPNEKVGGLMVKNYDIRDFVDCVATLDLLDLRQVGCAFTWSNSKVCSKLDRVLVNQQWVTLHLDGYVDFVPPGCVSDHTVSIVSFVHPPAKRDKPFKFFNMWALSDSFLETVARNWKFLGHGTAQYSLKQMLNNLKHPLKQLNKKQFSHISSRASAAAKSLTNLQRDMLHSGVTPNGYGEMKRRTELLLEAERSFIAQKAKLSYLQQGVTITEPDLIAELFVDYYKNLLGTRVNRTQIDSEAILDGPCVPVESWDALTAIVSSDEIEAALFDIDYDKAPGADGYGSFFFKKAWPVVKNDVVSAVQEFFQSARLLKQWNHAVIALIPKSVDSSSVNEFRPISCCTVFYKIIAKILSKRLGEVVGSLIDEAQAAFIRGRSIVDNIHLAQELLRKYARKRGSPRCILKVDIQKAYDTVDWSFLKEVLSGLNFPRVFIDWIMECVSTTSYSISLNGNYHGHFKGQRGLRQGDPLSPFLFTLCLEVLSRSLKRTSRSAHFGFHPKCANLRITHLAYADDLLLLSRGDTRSVSMIMECLNNFGDMAGLRVNLLKSNIYMAAIDDRVRDEILQITGFSPGNLPFRYLGVPLAARNLRSSDYSKLVESIAAKFNSWPRQSLSYAGKIELVRSVVQGIECFWLSILPIPNCIIDSIHSLCRKFVWPTKHPPIAWVTLCKSIDDGGLGLKNLKCWNKALIAKTLWKIQMRKESLWIRWVNHFYSKVGGVWSWGWHKDESPLIKQLIAIRDEIVLRMGSVDAASTTLQSWFSSGEGIGKAYDFFTKKVGKWPWKPLLSRSCILPKHKFTLWLVAHSKLRTRDRLPYAIDKACILCDGNIESVDHLFFRCAFSIAVWTDIKNWLGMSKIMGSTTAVLRAYRNHYGGKSMLARLRASALAATVYHIWNARNRRMFDDEKPRIEDIVKTIKILVLRCIPNSMDICLV